MKFEWEKIDWMERVQVRTWRAKVIGGWVLRTESWDEAVGSSESSVFIPDEGHCWEIEEN